MTTEAGQLQKAEAPTAGRAAAAELPDPGRRHSEWTLATMLRDAARDTIALRRDSGPVEALVLASGDAVIAAQLLGWGLDRVTGIDERPGSEAAAERPGLELHRVESITGLAPEEIGRFALVVVSDDALELCTDRVALLRLARRCCTLTCAIESRDRIADRDLAREAGFERVSLAPLPTDSERRWILGKRNLILAGVGAGEAR